MFNIYLELNSLLLKSSLDIFLSNENICKDIDSADIVITDNDEFRDRSKKILTIGNMVKVPFSKSQLYNAIESLGYRYKINNIDESINSKNKVEDINVKPFINREIDSNINYKEHIDNLKDTINKYKVKNMSKSNKVNIDKNSSTQIINLAKANIIKSINSYMDDLKLSNINSVKSEIMEVIESIFVNLSEELNRDGKDIKN